MATPTAEPRGLREIGRRAEDRILDLLHHETARWTAVDPSLAEPIDALADLVRAGGKRLRPAFCHWAYVGAGGDPDASVVVDAGAALELLHTFALIHDDIMDGSDLRRSLPTIHARFTESHAERRGRGESRRFGEGVGILVGDFAFAYADMCMTDIPETARAVYHELRVELCVGQYLDVLGSAGAPVDGELAERISVFKSGKYTVERPLHLGAALAGGLEPLEDALTRYGIPVGLAFQMRDDILGVFGDPAATGKPVGDDLREGKLTPLIAATVARVETDGTPGEQALMARLLEGGLNDDEVEALQALVISCGARDAIEDRITAAIESATAALSDAKLEPDAREALVELAGFVAWRET